MSQEPYIVEMLERFQIMGVTYFLLMQRENLLKLTVLF